MKKLAKKLGLKVKTSVKAGGWGSNHNRPVLG
jgi:hypothetical protein